MQKLPLLCGGGFLHDLPVPAAEHLADFVQGRGDLKILFIVKNLEFPCELEEEFQEIEFAACPKNETLFLCFAGITCKNDEFNRVQE